MSQRPSILVAVDFSEASAAAYRRARELAASFGADVHLLHVAEKPDWEGDAEVRQWLASTRVAADELFTLSGTPWVQIVRHCEVVNPVLLVVGSHGQRGYQTLGPGSTTARLLVRSPVPLLVVPMHERQWSRSGK